MAMAFGSNTSCWVWSPRFVHIVLASIFGSLLLTRGWLV
jgi:hypothetical protein